MGTSWGVHCERACRSQPPAGKYSEPLAMNVIHFLRRTTGGLLEGDLAALVYSMGLMKVRTPHIRERKAAVRA